MASRAKTLTPQGVDPVIIPEITGYDKDVRFYATRYKQGGRIVYSLDLSPTGIADLIPAPDPNVTSPGNRAIRLNHAIEFAKYLRTTESWVAPAILLRAPAVFEFEKIAEVEGSEFGYISFPRLAMFDIHILDGQHRTLGFHYAIRGIRDDMEKARNNRANAKRNEGEGSVALKDAEARIAELTKQRERMDRERVSIQIFVEEGTKAYRQMFFDIAENALGITASVKACFDTRKVVNRALGMVLEHPLLSGRVDIEADRLNRNSPYLMGAKHVAEVVRSVKVGLDGRVSRRQESEFSDIEIAKEAEAFFNMLMEAFPQIQAIMLGQLLPETMRKTSLLGSVLMVRILAGVSHDLLHERAFSSQNVTEFFAKLAPYMSGPVYPESVWMTEAPAGVFSDGAMAPSGRRQDMKALKDALVWWAIDKPDFLNAEPAPRPVAPSVEEEWAEEDSGYIDLGMDDPMQ